MIASLQKVSADDTPNAAADKQTALRSLMRYLGSVLVAYSGGVDSAFLSLIARQELGGNARIVLGISPSVSSFQQQEAEQIAERFGFDLEKIDTGEINDERYRANNSNRCYFCKSELYGLLTKRASELGIAAVLDGTNADDLGDHRPGRQAAAENKVRSPLAELGFTKDEIREWSRELGLSGWDRPAGPCLSSRIAHGVPVTIERLGKIEKGEALLRKLGFIEFRVRSHDELVRIEISRDEMQRVLDLKMFDHLTIEFRKLGYRFITLDLEGFRSGAMNLPS